MSSFPDEQIGDAGQSQAGTAAELASAFHSQVGGEVHHPTDDDGRGKKKKTKRRKVNHACLYCRRSHMTCDEGRPCQRW